MGTQDRWNLMADMVWFGGLHLGGVKHEARGLWALEEAVPRAAGAEVGQAVKMQVQLSDPGHISVRPCGQAESQVFPWSRLNSILSSPTWRSLAHERTEVASVVDLSFFIIHSRNIWAPTTCQALISGDKAVNTTGYLPCSREATCKWEEHMCNCSWT